MHPLVKSVEYAVRGALPIRAEALSQVKLFVLNKSKTRYLFLVQQLKKDPSKVDFNRVVFCNIGNPQQLNQKPITFFRQVISF